MKRFGYAMLALAIALCASDGAARAGAARTTYPVVFAHGMAGFDNILGYDYWGDDYGTFVGDPCDAFLEIYCNGDIDAGQKAYVAQVQPFQSSEVRGLDLANDIEGFMATAGASRVNLVGHSQGGLDLARPRACSTSAAATRS
jgi:triacylglycerol esterase/lipase EstA (alpha/beta hydrolase family)